MKNRDEKSPEFSPRDPFMDVVFGSSVKQNEFERLRNSFTVPLACSRDKYGRTFCTNRPMKENEKFGDMIKRLQDQGLWNPYNVASGKIERKSKPRADDSRGKGNFLFEF